MNNSYDANEQQSYDTQPKEPPFFADPAPLSLNQKEPVGFAVASMVLGILSLVCCCFAELGLILSILALLFAGLSRRQLHRFNGMALAGLIMGIIGVVLAAFSIIDAIINPVSQEELDAILKMYQDLLAQQGGIPSAFRALLP